MSRILLFLFLFAVLGFGAWPYYTLYRLDTALAAPEPEAIAPFVDVTAIQGHFKEQLGGTLREVMPNRPDQGGPLVDWLAQNLRWLGDTALEGVIDLEWVRDYLRAAAASATETRPAYFMAGVDHAFYESWNRFLIRLGPPERGTRVLLELKARGWTMGWKIVALENLQ